MADDPTHLHSGDSCCFTDLLQAKIKRLSHISVDLMALLTLSFDEQLRSPAKWDTFCERGYKTGGEKKHSGPLK